VKSWAFVKFEPKRVVINCSAREVLRKSSESSSFKVLANLGLEEVDVRVEGSKAFVEGFAVGLEGLKAVAEDEEGVYSLSEEGLSKLVIAGKHFYRLRRVADNTAPHPRDRRDTHAQDRGHNSLGGRREEGLADQGEARPQGPRHLRGLGLHRHTLSARGAEVLTVEVDPNVVKLASYNTWSWRLSDPRIRVILGDVCEVVKDLEDEAFDRVVHDPPRFSPRTGDLYGRELYSELYSVLKGGGLLFHYVGSPGRVRGLDLAKGVAKRLAEVGFEVKVFRSVEAVLAIKA